MKIAILEDNQARREAMESCLRDRLYTYDAVFFDSAKDLRRFLQTDLSSVILLSLDHDLELQQHSNGKPIDPGTGREIADFLVMHPPSFPVIIATTNSAAGDGMEFLLRDAKWDVHRVYPHGDLEWISTVWFRTVRNAVVGMAQPVKEPA
jgi:hypothetical protein